MKHDLNVILPDGYDKGRLIGELADDYSIQPEPAIDGCLAIYDTFDWRLFKKSLVLYACQNRVFLRGLTQPEIIQSARIDTFPVFVKAFPEDNLKSVLAPIVKMRALIKLVDVYYQSTAYRVLNADDKTVARLAYEEFRASRRQDAPFIGTRLRLKPVRGYADDAGAIAGRIKAAGFTVRKGADIYYEALASVGKKPGDYTAKPALRLDPDMPSEKAARAILHFLMQVIRTNEAHIEKDLDTEFIHDFRVSIRRTRSALGQLKNVFPTRENDRFKRDFAFVGKLTNELRDLDVLLLNEDRYRAMIPAMLRDGIDPLFAHLHRKRSKALRQVIRTMKTQKYLNIMKDWEAFLSEPREETVKASGAEIPAGELSRIRIYKKYRKIIKSGGRILENSEDDMLHPLRIHCKHIRYLMEFFYSLYPPRKMNVLIGQMKKLQNTLGNVNDLRIQRDYLMNVIEELPVSRRKSPKTPAAVGSLIGTLDRERQTAQKTVADVFTRFASPANQKVFQDLFASAL